MKTKNHCCDSSEENGQHPDHSQELHRLNRIRGQLEGIGRMIEEQRYCPDILVQLQATRAALSSLQSRILGRHLRGCVQQAFQSKEKKVREEQIDELLKLFSKLE